MRTRDRQFSHTVPAGGHRREPSRAFLAFFMAPQIWDLLNYPSAAVAGFKTSHTAAARACPRSHAVAWRLISWLWGHFALRILLGHPICFQGLLNPSNVHFKDRQGISCCGFNDTSVKLRSPRRGGQPRFPLPRHPCYENDTPPVTLFTPTVAVNFLSTLTFSSCTVTHDRLWCSV